MREGIVHNEIQKTVSTDTQSSFVIQQFFYYNSFVDSIKKFCKKKKQTPIKPPSVVKPQPPPGKTKSPRTSHSSFISSKDDIGDKQTNGARPTTPQPTSDAPGEQNRRASNVESTDADKLDEVIRKAHATPLHDPRKDRPMPRKVHPAGEHTPNLTPQNSEIHKQQSLTPTYEKSGSLTNSPATKRGSIKRRLTVDSTDDQKQCNVM